MAMRAADGAVKVLLDAFEWQGEGGAASDQHVIMSGANAFIARKPDDLAQAAADAIAFHRIADFPRNGEADAGRARVAAARNPA